MKKKEPQLVDEYLKSLEGIKVVEPNNLFYERLIDRLTEEEVEETVWVFPLKPVWMIASLAIFLALNIFVLRQYSFSQKYEQGASIENFADAYDQNINSSY